MSCINKKRNSGYIALISAIIMTTILILVSITTSHSSFLGRFDSQVLEYKDKSYNLASGCLDHAKLKLAQGSYAGNETIAIGVNTCSIGLILNESGNTVITSTATIGNTITNLRLVVNSTLNLVSLKELAGPP